jgi:hypothetical protein
MHDNADAFIHAIFHVLLFIVVHGARNSTRKPRNPKPSFKRKEIP